MSAVAPVPGTARASTQHALHLMRWSWAMVPVFVVVWFVVGLVSYASLGLFGLHEGDLVLMAHSVAAWAFDVASWLALAAAPVLGIALAVRAERAGAHAPAWAIALGVNAVVLLVVAYQVVDEIRMSYFPG